MKGIRKFETGMGVFLVNQGDFRHTAWRLWRPDERGYPYVEEAGKVVYLLDFILAKKLRSEYQRRWQHVYVNGDPLDNRRKNLHQWPPSERLVKPPWVVKSDWKPSDGLFPGVRPYGIESFEAFAYWSGALIHINEFDGGVSVFATEAEAAEGIIYFYKENSGRVPTLLAEQYAELVGEGGGAE